MVLVSRDPVPRPLGEKGRRRSRYRENDEEQPTKSPSVFISVGTQFKSGSKSNRTLDLVRDVGPDHVSGRVHTFTHTIRLLTKDVYLRNTFTQKRKR